MSKRGVAQERSMPQECNMIMRWAFLCALGMPLLTGGCATYLNYADAKIAAHEAEQRLKRTGNV
ncbi:MAG: hypothetical protein AAF986_10770, partial [Pseudomonadota bacterium]